MPHFANPIHAPPAKKSAAGPAAVRPPARRLAPSQQAALSRVLQLRAKDRAAAAPSAETPSRGGLPERLKAGVERLSGLAMGDVRVHRDSTEPARLGALAYTQGSDIHLGPGQERHLPHEAWHVVQQKQGRVGATTQMKGLPVNEDQDLEKEADRMSTSLGATAAIGREAPITSRISKSTADPDRPVQLQKHEKNASQPPQSIIDELAREKFSQLMEAQRLNEEINGAAAKALASAYLSTAVPSSQVQAPSAAAPSYLTTPAQAVQPVPPTFEEVYKAILSVMDVASTDNGKKVGAWRWTPAHKDGKTRREVPVEIIEWAGEEAKDAIVDEARAKLIERIAVKSAAKWGVGTGLQITAEVSLVALEVIGYFNLAVSIAALLVLLMRPAERDPTRQDKILADVVAWLKGYVGTSASGAGDSYPEKPDSYYKTDHPVFPTKRLPGR